LIQLHRQLHISLVSNALFSFFSGLVMILQNDWLSDYTGVSNSMIFTFIGVALIIFACVIGLVARTSYVKLYIVLSIIVLDISWVVGSLILISLNVLLFQGNILTAVLAIIVSLFAVLQITGLRRSTKSRGDDYVDFDS
jgi:4-amino-4-deoxy-L-arabinose transferase-like glycosyltransferase